MQYSGAITNRLTLRQCMIPFFSRSKEKQETIKKKLVTMSMMTSFIAVLLTAILFVVYGAYTTRNAVINELTLIKEMVIDRSAASLEWDNNKVAQEGLDTLKVKQSIIAACIYNKAGEVFAAYGEEKPAVSCPVLDGRSVSVGRYDYIIMYDDIMSTDIMYKEQKIGTIYIKSDMRDFNKEIPKYLMFAIFLMAGTTGIAYLISSSYQKHISAPILELASITQRIVREGDYSVEAKKYANDEIGTLTTSFNRMMSVTNDLKQNLEFRVKERTEKLANTLVDLENALAAKTNFLSNMSHEIRTPNHAVLNCSQYAKDDLSDIIELLKEDVPSEKTGKILTIVNGCLGNVQRICDASHRVGNLLNNILDLSKFGEGKMELNFERHDLNGIVQRTVQESEGLCQGRDLRIAFTEAACDTSFICDKGRMTQVISNLLGNALKYSDKGVITLEISETELEAKPALAFAIFDQGIGIPERELELIFEKFTESSKTKQQSGGTGIGLAICEEVILAHGGKIWAENRPEGGSVFRFIVPREQS